MIRTVEESIFGIETLLQQMSSRTQQIDARLERLEQHMQDNGEHMAVLRSHVIGNGNAGLVARMAAVEKFMGEQRGFARAIAVGAGVMLGTVGKLAVGG